MGISPDSLAQYQEAKAKAIPFVLKTEVPPFESDSAWEKAEPAPKTGRDVTAFRAKRR